MKTTLEIEVKLACSDIDRLRNAGLDLTLIEPRYFEDNWLLDTPDHKLHEQGAALRVRSIASKGLVTFKGIAKESASSVLRVREEIESETTDPERMIDLFEKLGFYKVFRYQKYRTVYNLVIGGCLLEAVFDETPMGSFIEIEGDESAVLRALETARFTEQDFIRDTYPELQESRCKALGIPLEDLVFQGRGFDDEQ